MFASIFSNRAEISSFMPKLSAVVGSVASQIEAGESITVVEFFARQFFPAGERIANNEILPGLSQHRNEMSGTIGMVQLHPGNRGEPDVIRARLNDRIIHRQPMATDGA